MMNIFASLEQSLIPSLYDFERESPIFSIDEVRAVKFPRPISHVQISNGVLIAAAGNHLLRKYLTAPDRKTDSIQIVADATDHVNSLFMDPEGRHILISMQAVRDNFYIHTAAFDRVKVLPKLQGRISAVAWNKRGSAKDSETGPILVGTEEGTLSEVLINQSDGLKYCKQLFSVPRTGIHGIFVETLNQPKPTDGKPTSFLIFVTPGRLYQRVGELSNSAPVYQNLFPTIDESGAPISGVKFMEFPRDFGYSFLRWYPMYESVPPKTLVWCTGPGIYMASTDFSPSYVFSDNVLTRTSLIQYPKNGGLLTGMQLTQFHIIVTFSSSVKAINIINEKVVFSRQLSLNKDERMMGLVRDPVTQAIFIQTSFGVYPLLVNNEIKDIWKMYLEIKEYDLAKAFCHSSEQCNIVLLREADDHYENADYIEAAMLYAKTSLSFEEVALKFVNLESQSGLKTYLKHKIGSLNTLALQQQQQQQQQISDGDLLNLHRLPVLVMWLVEIYLSRLSGITTAPLREVEDHETLLKEFHAFLVLPSVMECLRLQPQLVYTLMDSHGNGEEKVYFAKLLKDHERVVEHYINEDNYEAALDEIMSQKSTSLYYRYANILVKHIPAKTVNAFIKKGASLNPKRLVHALLQAHPLEAQRYLEYATGPMQCRDQEVHNLLISLYATNVANGDGSGLQKLLNYLRQYESAAVSGHGGVTLSDMGDEADPAAAGMGFSAMGLTSMTLMSHEFPFDPQYALRVCAEYGLVDASVRLHSMFGMHQEAVLDALSKDDIQLAKEITKTPFIDDEVKKQLWLRIARHVIDKKKDIKEATELIKESELLKLEDVLPFFPNFVTIELFKDAICESLDLYNQQIEKMRADMKEATSGAAEIRRQMLQFRHRYVTVAGEDECAHCKYPLMMKAFYLFPCGHYYHSDCLAEVVRPRFSPKDRARFAELLENLTHSPKSMTPPSLRTEIDDMIASDCFLCGEAAIESVDEPLFDLESYAQEMSSWE